MPEQSPPLVNTAIRFSFSMIAPLMTSTGGNAAVGSLCALTGF
jgi:hypothetical protein